MKKEPLQEPKINVKDIFETVNGGTIFLDEIGEMPVRNPSTALTRTRVRRVYQGRFIRSPVQKTKDVRIVAATNRNLLKAAEQGKFREEDLYYRLSTVPITMPALRDRGDDILLLFRKFATDFAERHERPIQLSEDAQSLLPALSLARECQATKKYGRSAIRVGH